MGEILSYSIIAGLIMLLLYLSYRLFLARDNQHGFNRAVLLMIYFVSFSAPLLIYFFEIYFFESFHRNSASELLSLEIEVTTVSDRTDSKPIWGTILIWIYLVGTAVVAVKTAVTWIRLCKVIRSGIKIKSEGHTLVITRDLGLAPFSWWRYIVINEKDYEDNCRAIIIHELGHITLYHRIDLMVSQIVCIANWFNPAVWLMRDELMLVHEYQADMTVIESGRDIQEYQILLIKKAVGSRFPSLANSLNHSKLKKRITMMYKEKSGAGRKFKALALVPALALALGVAAIPAVKAAVSAISESDISVGKVSEISPQKQTDASDLKVSNIYIVNDGEKNVVTIKGHIAGNNINVSGGTFTNGGKIYKANSMSCDMKNGEAEISVSFPFSAEIKDAVISLTINGKETAFDLDKLAKGSKSVKIKKKGNPETETLLTILASSTGESAKDMTYYLNGVKISFGELDKVPADKITSITVDKQSNDVKLTTK